jgi:hypothetical protein
LVLVMTLWTWNNMPLVWCNYCIQDYAGKHEGMWYEIPLINCWGWNSSPKPPYNSIGQNTSWTGFLLCFTNYGENTYKYILITVQIMSTLLLQPPPAFFVFHFSYKPERIFLSKSTHMKHLVFAWQ